MEFTKSEEVASWQKKATFGKEVHQIDRSIPPKFPKFVIFVDATRLFADIIQILNSIDL